MTRAFSLGYNYRVMTYKDLSIVYEDNHLIVVVKPQGVPCCPDGTLDIDLLSLLKEYRKVNENKPGDAYVGLIHRLDRPTGGVMAFAKTSKCAERMSAMIKNHEIEKKYLAILDGTLRDKRGELVHYLKKDEKFNLVRVVGMATEGARRAALKYKVLSEIDGRSLVDIDLETGRTHQIRVQMATMGAPLQGDHKYGKSRGREELALWAYQLKFVHPVTKETMTFRVYTPEDSVFSSMDANRYLSLSVKD